MGRAKKADNLTRMQGIITASGWDEENNVTSITLSTADEMEYPIHQDNKGKQLLRFLQKEVVVTGVLDEDALGRKKLRILSYSIKQDM